MIQELHQKLINGQTTSVALTKEYFGAIEKKDGEIGAYLALFKEDAIKQAEEADRGIKRGKKTSLLAGIPCAVKDNICVEGTRTTAASKILDNYIAPYDATAIKKLKKAGAVILGKTNLDEFAMGASTENSAYQKTKNPIDPERVPGGSSGGSAAAVAAEMAVWALGSDTGGSIRQPASFCGITGLKPTYGRVSRHGLIAMASSLDQIGPLAASAEDCAIILSSIAGQDPLDATSAESFGKPYEDYLTGDIQGKKIGIPREFMAGLPEDIKKVFDEAVSKFEKLGARIIEIGLKHCLYALPAYYIIVTSEVSSNLARFDGVKYGMRINDLSESVGESYSSENPGRLPKNLLETYLDTRRIGLGTEVKRRIMLGTYALSAGYYDAYYKKAQKVRALIKKDFEEAFGKVDYIFSPTAPEVAFKFGEKTEDPLKMYLSDIYTVTANLAGVPAVSFPAGSVKIENKNLPVGAQLMGKWFDEEGILNAVHAFEIKQ